MRRAFPAYRRHRDPWSIMPSRLSILAVAICATAVQLVAGGLDAAFTINDIDVPNCRLFVGGQEANRPTADGETVLWEYPSPYTVHAGFYGTPFRHQRPPGVLSQEHRPIGHFTVGDEEFFVTNSAPGTGTAIPPTGCWSAACSAVLAATDCSAGRRNGRPA